MSMPQSSHTRHASLDSNIPTEPSSSRPHTRRTASMPLKPVASLVSDDIEPATWKPPSHHHNFTGDSRAQDLFAEAIDAQRRKGETYSILYPGSDDFEMERMDMFNHDSICTPCLILQPSNKAEVSSCIRGYTIGVRHCLKENRRTGSKLGIPRLCVSGGRCSMHTFTEWAIVLDLSRMKEVTVDVKKRTAICQGGARVHDVDMVCGRHGLMCITGTYQELGIVGCILGGGYGYASRKHGLAADNVLQAEIVLADGSFRYCSPRKNSELFWSILGGGGGIGVIVGVQLKCYPLRNAALVTFDLLAPGTRWKRSVLRNWNRWIMGDEGPIEDEDMGEDDESSYQEPKGAPMEVYSQLILPTSSAPLSFVGTSVDPEVIPQDPDRIKQFNNMMRMKSKWGVFSVNASRDSDSYLPAAWSRIPGLCDLHSHKLGAAVRSNMKFRLVRYFDQLQSLSAQFHKPGNVFIAFKYAKTLSARIIAVLVEATAGKMSPKNESRIFISTLGCEISEVPKENTAFDARDMNYVIYIEGRWNETTKPSRDEQERKTTVAWVRWVCSQLHLCEGIKSTAHPESSRDQVSKSGKSKPPPGWYNFSKENGERLDDTKKHRDSRNVFAFASRVSWMKSDGSGQPGGGLDSTVFGVEDTTGSDSPGSSRTSLDSKKSLDEGEFFTAPIVEENNEVELALM